VVTATVTRTDTGDTSEFSQAVLPTTVLVAPVGGGGFPFGFSAAAATAQEATTLHQTLSKGSVDDMLQVRIANGNLSVGHASRVTVTSGARDDTTALAGVLIGLLNVQFDK